MSASLVGSEMCIRDRLLLISYGVFSTFARRPPCVCRAFYKQHVCRCAFYYVFFDTCPTAECTPANGNLCVLQGRTALAQSNPFTLQVHTERMSGCGSPQWAYRQGKATL
eukprot:6796225-Alexandrium_andersonii.AAC.1